MSDATEVEAHIDGITPERRREEARRLDRLFRDVTGYAPRLWSGRMIGYGVYDYTYKSGRSGSFLATGFAMGASQISLYIMPGYADFGDILARLGKHKHGKACLYLTRLDNADETALADLIRAGLRDLATRWPVRPA